MFKDRDKAGGGRKVTVVDNNPNMITSHAEDSYFDGEEELVLHPKPTKHGKTLREMLEDIRNEPKLVMLNMPVVRNLQDTQALWTASKHAMLTTIGAVHEQKCLAILHQRCDLDDEPVRVQLREIRMQLQTTIGTWTEHLKFLQDQSESLSAGILKAENEVGESKTQLAKKNEVLVKGGGKGSERCIAASRVLMNAANALESTQNERRLLIEKRYKTDRVTHADTLRSLIEALGHFVSGFASDLDEVKGQAKIAQALIDDSIRQKQAGWHQTCQTLQARYMKEVHLPLQQLLHDLKSNRDKDAPYTEPLPVSIDIAQEGLSEANDPHCIRRVEVARLELISLQTYLTKITQANGPLQAAHIASNSYDDEAFRHAKAERAEEMALAQDEHDQRMAALLNEQRDKKMALVRAKEHMRGLRDRAEQIKNAVSDAWQSFQAGDATPETNRQAAALTRLANQRQYNLRDEMQRSSEVITRLHAELVEARNKVTAADRRTQATRYLAVTNNVYELCKRMRSQFEMAIHGEEMMRRIVRDQFTDSAKSCHQISSSIIQKVLDTARSRFNLAAVDLASVEDEINEASRRIDTLNNARLEQELHVDGPEIGVYTALEEHVVLCNQVHQLKDSLAKTNAMVATCNSALLLLNDLVLVLEGI